MKLHYIGSFMTSPVPISLQLLLKTPPIHVFPCSFDNTLRCHKMAPKPWLSRRVVIGVKEVCVKLYRTSRLREKFCESQPNAFTRTFLVRYSHFRESLIMHFTEPFMFTLFWQHGHLSFKYLEVVLSHSHVHVTHTISKNQGVRALVWLCSILDNNNTKNPEPTTLRRPLGVSFMCEALH